MASRDTKWRMAFFKMAGQVGLTHRNATSSVNRVNGLLHAGHFVGTGTGCSRPVRTLVTTLTTFGIMSPPFSTKTVSPIRMSFRAISSKLCRDAR